MKKLRLAVIALVIGATAFAATKAGLQKNDAPVLWEYTVNSTNPADENNPANYHFYDSSNPMFECKETDAQVICLISATPDASGSQPVIPTSGARSVLVKERDAQ